MRVKKNSIRAIISMVLVVCLVAVTSVGVNAYVIASEGNKLVKTITFTPHRDFAATSISHFNEACWEWDKNSNKYAVYRNATSRHTDTNFYKDMKTDNKIYKEANTSHTSPGTTYVLYNKRAKEVNSAAININTSLPFSNGSQSKTYDVWTVFVHELGHVIGFDHNLAPVTQSVMHVLPAGLTNRYLSNDDVAGIRKLYP